MNIKKVLKSKKIIGNWVTFLNKDDKEYKYRGICIDEVVVLSNDYAHRLQKIIWCQEKKNKKSKWTDFKKGELDSSIRVCYWVINRKRNGMVFGRFCVTSSPNVISELFKKAYKKGFFKKMTKNQMLKELKKFRK